MLSWSLPIRSTWVDYRGLKRAPVSMIVVRNSGPQGLPVSWFYSFLAECQNNFISWFSNFKYFIQRSGEGREEKNSIALGGHALPELTAILMPQLSKGRKGTSYYTQLPSSYTQLAFEKKILPDLILNLYVFFGHLHSTVKNRIFFYCECIV